MRHGTLSRPLATIGFGLIVASSGAAAQEALVWKLRLDSGAEVDTNIHRVERIEGDEQSIVTAPLLRLGVDGDVAWRRKKFSAQLSASSTAKLFLGREGRSENVAAARLEGLANVDVGDEGSRVGGRIRYYNATGLRSLDEAEEGLGRNFSTALGELVASVPGPDNHRVSAALGYRDFIYKPNDDFDWRGEHFRLSFLSTLWRGDPEQEAAAAIDLSVSYGLGRRNYEGGAFANSCPPGDPITPECFMPTDARRRDLHHTLAGSVSYTGDRIYGARYELRVNDSNSFGQSLVRQRLELSFTSGIGDSGIFATAKVAVLFNHFLDPLLLARDVSSQSFDSIDDENRNGLSLHASKETSENLSVEARYALFTNEFATQERTFRRQTFYAGLVYRFK